MDQRGRNNKSKEQEQGEERKKNNFLNENKNIRKGRKKAKWSKKRKE